MYHIKPTTLDMYIHCMSCSTTLTFIKRKSCAREVNVLLWLSSLKDKYPNFEVGLKCFLMVFPYLLLCSYLNENVM